MTDGGGIADWLPSRPGSALEPLFRTDADLVVRTENDGRDLRPVLCRHPRMERAMTDLVEQGLADPHWDGILSVMGRGPAPSFSPLYVGKAERRGRKNSINAIFRDIGANRRMFARWGDDFGYHIGDLSHALFRFQADRPVTRTYQRWATTLFASSDPPRLRAQVALYLLPWYRGDVGPTGVPLPLSSLEETVIAHAVTALGEELLNRCADKYQFPLWPA
jgi:hypothetical protein